MASNSISKHTGSRPPSSQDHGLQVHISELDGSQLQSASPKSLDQGLKEHLQTRSITISKFISQLGVSRPPSASLSSLDLDLQVHFQTRSITASKCISKLARSRYPSTSLMIDGGFTGIQGYWRWTERHGAYIWETLGQIELISVSSHLDPRKCMDYHGRVISYHLTFFLDSSSQNLRSCSTPICGQIDRMSRYRDTWIMYAILWCSESCDCNKDDYERRNALSLWNPLCGFWTDWDFSDEMNELIPMNGHSWLQRGSVQLQ